jgi:hypothetical protein
MIGIAMYPARQLRERLPMSRVWNALACPDI